MNVVEFKKISLDGKNYYDVVNNLDLKNRTLSFTMNIEQLTIITKRKIGELLFNPDIVYNLFKNIYVKDSNNIEYSCINCFFKTNFTGEVVEFNSVSIDSILKNTVSDDINIKADKVIFKTRYVGCGKYNAYIKSYNIKYSNNISIDIDVKVDMDTHIDISINSKKISNYNKLSYFAFTYIELLLLCFGEMPLIEEIVLCNGSQKIDLYYSLADKYLPCNRAKCKELITIVDNTVINDSTMKNFRNFRKKTKIIYDLLMTNMVSNTYIEIRNCSIIQIFEGVYNSINNTEYPLYKVLNKCFIKNSNTKMILTKRDKVRVKNKYRTPIFLYKCSSHRNYLSHLNQNQYKNVFVKKENWYAYWKITLCLRIIIADSIGIKCDKSMIDQYLERINKWGKKLRFSHKLNSDDKLVI